ncbi:MFS transporter [Candidatus Uhrbacteria bacterium]|nr:MFS transporter [Candidatus Uhrbacteria bacterium]
MSEPLASSFPATHRRSIAHLGAFPTLASNRLIGFIGSSMLGVFLPIFLYEFFDASLSFVLLWFAIDFLIKLPFYVPAARAFSRIGLVRSMMIGTLGMVLFYGVFFLLDKNISFHPFVLMAIGMFGLSLDSTFYWSPFHIDMAKFMDAKRRGIQLGAYYSLQQIMSVVTPLAAAFLIAHFGYRANFFAGLIISFLSIIPLFFVPERRVRYEFGYLESLRKLFSKKFRAMSFSMMALGAENIVASVVWPIFLFSLFRGSYLEVGGVTAAIIVISLVLEMVVGKETDRMRAGFMIKWGTWIYALGWVAKGIVSTLTGVFAASTFHSFSSIVVHTPLDALTYQQAADSGHYIDEYTVLREMSLGIGRVVMLLLLIPLTTSFSIGYAFFAAAVVSLGMNWLVQYHAQES